MEPVAYLRYVLALGLVLGLIALMGWAGKKYGWAQLGIKLPPRAGKRLHILEVQSIDTRNRIILLRRDQTDYMLAVNPDGITILDMDIPAPSEDRHEDEAA